MGVYRRAGGGNAEVMVVYDGLGRVSLSSAWGGCTHDGSGDAHNVRIECITATPPTSTNEEEKKSDYMIFPICG